VTDTYTKLFRSIAASTIVSEPVATRWFWVTLLSQSDKNGCVWGSVPGLARIANLTIPEVETALECFMAPDPYSRTTEHDGRRIEAIDGGWRLLNHAKYDAMRSAAERSEYKRKWDRENRPSGHARAAQSDRSPTKTPESPTAVRQQSDSKQGESDTSPTQSEKTRQSDPTSHFSLLTSQEEAKAKTLERQAARFPEFWAAYPLKKGRAAALAKWKSCRLDGIADKIIADVQARLSADAQWLDGYIPHGSTYVSQRVWEDEIVPQKPKDRKCGTSPSPFEYAQ
jgi:hypothetical protein